MRDGRRFLLTIVTVLLLFSAGLVAVWKTTEPTEAVVVDTPILAAQVTTSTSPPNTAPTDTIPPASAAPVAPPKNAYAPEPVIEIGTIEIPKIGLNHRVWHGISMRNIDNGPSHWPGTALPGQVGNAVFAGHRVTHSHPFRRIHELAPGDEVFFTVDPAKVGAAGEAVRVRYVVTGSEVVPPTAMRIVDPTATPTATLFACHPPGSARQRYVVKLALATT